MEVGIWGMVGGVVTTFATAATTWAFSRKQSRVELEKLRQEVETMEAMRASEVKTAEIEIMNKYRDLYNSMIDDLRTRIEQMIQDAAIQEERHEMQIKVLQNEVDKLKAEIRALKTEFPCADCPRRKPSKN